MSFAFSKDAAEFVPGPSGSAPAFNWNPGAREFQPIIPIPQQNVPQGGKGFAGACEDAGTQAPVMQAVPVVAQGMGVYPVMAVPVPRGMRPRAVGYMSPGNASLVAGYAGGEYQEQQGCSPQSLDGKGKGGGPSKGAHRRQDGARPSRGGGGKGAGRYSGDLGSTGGCAGKGGPRPLAEASAVPPVEEAPVESKEAEVEAEPEEKKDPSKKSWADIARKAAAAPPSQTAGRMLPKRVAKKPEVLAAAASAAAPADKAAEEASEAEGADDVEKVENAEEVRQAPTPGNDAEEPAVFPAPAAEVDAGALVQFGGGPAVADVVAAEVAEAEIEELAEVEEERITDEPADCVAAQPQVQAAAELDVAPPAPPKPRGAPDVIRYSIAPLMSIRNAPDVVGSPCPETIPLPLRIDEEDPAPAPAPKPAAAVAEDPDDWRAQAGRQEARAGTKSGRSGAKASWRQEAAKLETSENSWASKQQAGKQDSDVAVTRAMKSILNKLTVDKFDTLYQKLLECGISKGAHIETLVREVFEKATTQHHFIEMYTDLCIKLNEWVTEQGLVDSEGEKVNFKRMLLNQCQGSFDMYLKPPAGLEELEGDEHVEAKMKYKTTMLGNMKFVGQLLCNKVVSPKIIEPCCLELIHHSSEETLETLCVFLSVVGPAFDKREHKSYHVLADVFQQVRKMCSDQSVPARLRCLLKDVLDLRAAGWVSTRPTNLPEGPKTMDEVKSQWAKEVAAQERRASMGGGRSSAPPTPSGGQHLGEWETVSGGSRRSGGGSFRGGDGPSSAGLGPSGGRFGFSSQDRDLGERSAARLERTRPAPMGRSGSEHFPFTPSRGAGRDGRDGREGREPQRATPKSARERPSLLDEGIRLGPSIRTSPAHAALRPMRSPAASSGAAQAPRQPSREELREQIGSILRALQASHDVAEAITAAREMNLLAERQQDVLVQILLKGSEASEAARRPMWSFLQRIYVEEVFQRQALAKGMDVFMSDYFEDLRCDVPKLPEILEEEVLPALGDKAGLLSATDIAGFLAKVKGGEDSPAV
mmetsp:Transcript_86038/g.248416  ORF Transcript_86038/g.248416 Transcript_86038/m.248416 type:complete len:1040 (-) Transcript_86038:428-3547(-)